MKKFFWFSLQKNLQTNIWKEFFASLIKKLKMINKKKQKKCNCNKIDDTSKNENEK